MNNRSVGSILTRRNVILAFGIVAVAISSFVIGDSFGQRSMRKPIRIQVDGVQAMFLVDRIVEERKVKSLLARGCATETMTMVDHQENSDLKLLTEFVNGDLDRPALAYITNQAPDILNELKTFKSKYGNTWREPVCSN
jgi:hypothetical protein